MRSEEFKAEMQMRPSFSYDSICLDDGWVKIFFFEGKII